METIFIVLVLTVLVLNTIIMRSKTQWWRDPASLFRRDEEPEPEVPAVRADTDPKKAADWVRAAQAQAAEMARSRPAAQSDSRRATDPRELTPRRPTEVPHAARHAVRSDEPMTDVFARITEEEAPTRLMGRVPAGYPDEPAPR